MSKLEKDWDKTVKEINSKIKEAGKLLAEANELAEKAGVEYLTTSCQWIYDELTDAEVRELQKKTKDIDFHPVLGELDVAGWATSSLWC